MARQARRETKPDSGPDPIELDRVRAVTNAAARALAPPGFTVAPVPDYAVEEAWRAWRKWEAKRAKAHRTVQRARRRNNEAVTVAAIQVGLDYLTELGRVLTPVERLLFHSLRPRMGGEEYCGCDISCNEPRRIIVDLGQFLDFAGRRLSRPLARIVRILEAEPKWRERIGRCLVCTKWYVDTSPAQRRMACLKHADSAQHYRKRLRSSPLKPAKFPANV